MLFYSFFIAFTFANAANAMAGNAQSVTIQQFPIEASESKERVHKLGEAMSLFKASNKGKIDRAFLGKISDSVVEQIFVLNTPLETVEPFLPFTSSPEQLSSTTAVLDNMTSFYDALYAQSTETLIQDVVPGADLDVISEAMEYLEISIRNTSGGYGSAFGFSQKEEEGKTQVVVVNGWESFNDASSWLSNLDNITATYFQTFSANVVGSAEPTFKHLTEVE
ncbi:hypothetical protein AAF712_012270 [Marasmius tenuissimus]|uniref:Uncharacterized protein n=1 Tax=Marasmius tenuissimus TaxID=585030 RepID=A0ABR2ZI99_9AGAR|nr:hypothetical protein PM082_007257 [Marasmius tenuissimus]